MFLLKEFFKSFVWSKKKRIGFVLSVLPTPYYGVVMASTRLRVYDVINNFQGSKTYFLELYRTWKHYDVVIFQKKFDDSAFELAQKLQKKGVKIILDINVNYYDPSAFSIVSNAGSREHDQILRFTKLADGVITSTDYIRDYAQKIFPGKEIISIPENITDNFFSTKKVTRPMNSSLKLMYVGYGVKVKEILDIESVLQHLHKKYHFTLLLICDKDPKITIPGIQIEFIRYRQKRIAKDMLEGDIFIAPRDVKNPYNLGHSFTKIGYPMAIGIPVVASKIPSYAGSPALLCENGVDWYNNLNLLLGERLEREKMGEKGIDYCRRYFSQKTSTERYLSFFNTILPHHEL